MGLLDDLENRAVSGMLSGSNNPLATGLLQMINNQPGGLAGFVQMFHEKGLGGLAASWVSTGHNLPISAEQIQHVLGGEQVKELAAQAGLSPDVAGASISQMLPSLVDKLTPDGQMPQHSNLIEMGMSVLQSLGRTGTNG
jgi:uncharacterized protein YidB (DUF937 family)